MYADQAYNEMSKFTDCKAITTFWKVCQKLLVHMFASKEIQIMKKCEKMKSC